MFYRGKRALRRAWFNFNCRGLLDTPPLDCGDGSLTLVSMVCHGEVLMYLLAAKSFSRHLDSNPNVIILNDGSLTKDDQATILAHIPAASLLHISAIVNDRCPKGACWERLLLISDIVQDSYVVQLDSDTLTSRPIPEVKESIAANRSFTLLGDKSFSEVEPMLSASLRYKTSVDPQVQAVCERSFDQLPESASLKYIRGNAGFTGFAKGAFNRDKVAWFSDLMRRLVNEKWDTWGSEQLTSNLLIADSENPYPLPFPKYCSYWAHPDVQYEQSSFIHFIGPHRYDNGFYLNSARRAIAALRQPKT